MIQIIEVMGFFNSQLWPYTLSTRYTFRENFRREIVPKYPSRAWKILKTLRTSHRLRWFWTHEHQEKLRIWWQHTSHWTERDPIRKIKLNIETTPQGYYPTNDCFFLLLLLWENLCIYVKTVRKRPSSLFHVAFYFNKNFLHLIIIKTTFWDQNELHMCYLS